MNGIEFEEGQYGLRAVLRSPWSDAFVAHIRTRRCAEIELNQAKGWSGNDLSFLSEFPRLEAFHILDLRIKSVEPIHALHEVRSLGVTTYCLTELQFSAFPKLEHCGFEWRPKATSLFNCITLKHLFVNRYKGGDLSPFSSLKNLESLAVFNAPISSLDGVASLTKLRRLRLGNLKKLRSLDGIQSLTGLEELEVHTCRKVTSINEVAMLSGLKRLYLIDDGEVDSLKPLDSLRNLESVLFYESTNIVDGDLAPLFRQKSLSKVSFQNRRHYSHTREEFGATYSK